MTTRSSNEAAPDPDAPRVVLVTAPVGEPARELARGLVEARLVACVNLLSGVESVYRWQGAVETDPETLLVAKTTAGRLREVEAWLAEHHPYDVPECVALEPAAVAAPYLAWLVGEVRTGG